MPGTGDVSYVLGPSLVALALSVVILVVVRVLRRGPAVAPRSAPHHGLPQPVPAQRGADGSSAVARAADGRCLAVRPSDAARSAAARRALTGH